MPKQVVKNRQDDQGSPHREHAGHQRPRPGEDLSQTVSQTRSQDSGMAISRQPPQVRSQGRIKSAYPAITPTDRLASRCSSIEHLPIGFRDPIVLADVDHESRPVTATHEVVRSMPGAIGPVNPKRLRQNTNNIWISIQGHQLIPFQPGLMPDMRARRREPPQTRKVALTTKRREVPDRRAVMLERHYSSPVEPLTQPTLASGEFQVHSTRDDLCGDQRRRRPHTETLSPVPQIQ